MTEKLVAVAASDADAVFVAIDPASAAVLGVASVHVLPLFHAPGSLGRLTALAVRRSAQRRGVGRALVAAVEAFAWAAGCARMEVTSVEKQSLPDSLFTPPPGFKKFDPAEMMRGMGGPGSAPGNLPLPGGN